MDPFSFLSKSTIDYDAARIEQFNQVADRQRVIASNPEKYVFLQSGYLYKDELQTHVIDSDQTTKLFCILIERADNLSLEERPIPVDKGKLEADVSMLAKLINIILCQFAHLVTQLGVFQKKFKGKISALLKSGGNINEITYTRSGFNRASRNFENEEVNVDLTGRSIAITGANSGIGLETALALAEKGAKIHLICRNQARGQVALEQVKLRSKEGVKPVLHILDMSHPSKIYEFVKIFNESGQPLHILVNNAGCMVQQRSIVDGVESNFSTNALGVYILTKELLPTLLKEEDPRVITVSSAGMYTQKLNYNDFNNEAMQDNFDGTAVYAQNKRQQVVMMEEFALGYPQIFFATMHPGWSDTEAVKSSMPGFYKVMHGMLRTPTQGADTVIWLCTMSSIHRKFKSGQFFQDRQIVTKHLSCCGTKSAPEENKLFINLLDDLSCKFAS
ncbi:hypothetical protein GJ496_010815 [Pomphorhynchus laevis]|nr:hypothetical protein GJ496_010815 [Pomphorhynchus laevis]